MRDIQKEVHQLAISSGWWPEGADMGVIPEKLMLVVSEVSEALECYRTPEDFKDHFSEDGKPEGFGIELADAVIRILDLSEWLGLDMENLILTKHSYNKTRSYRHGGKLA